MADNDEKTTKGVGILGLVKALGIVSFIVIVEVVAASMLIPSAQDTESDARKVLAARQGDEALTGDDGADDSQNKMMLKDTLEFDIGRYNVTRYNPENNTTLIIDFELYGVVLADDQGEFESQFESNKVRVREQVIMTLGGAEVTDLTDPELSLLKRRILEKTNRALGRPLLHEVLFSKFNFVER